MKRFCNDKPKEKAGSRPKTNNNLFGQVANRPFFILEFFTSGYLFSTKTTLKSRQKKFKKNYTTKKTLGKL